MTGQPRKHLDHNAPFAITKRYKEYNYTLISPVL